MANSDAHFSMSKGQVSQHNSHIFISNAGTTHPSLKDSKNFFNEMTFYSSKETGMR